MNKQILHIAIPSIISNITIPLLALVDTTLVGHLGAAAYIGAIAVGGMLFNMAYWLFGFLRMGTGGLTAQAYGAGRKDEALRILCRSLCVSLSIGLLLVLLQRPLLTVAFQFITATPEVQRLASVYFNVLIWGAPAVLSTYSFVGWFLGMQNAKVPMLIAVVQNVVNIVASVSLVFGFHLKVEGVALGTLLAQYVGVLVAVGCWLRCYKPAHFSINWQKLFCKEAFGRFFKVNFDIFLRTLCLIAVTTYFTATGSAQGELTLAANTLLMQFFVLFSYVMDGFAYAGEALGGKFYGAKSREGFQSVTRHLFAWGTLLALLYTLCYLLFGTSLLHLLTDDGTVIGYAQKYLPYVCALPLLSFSAFLFDGLFIGSTATRLMLLSMATAAAVFFIMLHFMPATNATLWTAFLSYLTCRGLVQSVQYRQIKKKMTKEVEQIAEKL